MSLKVYIDFISQPSRAVLTLLKLAKIPHQVEIISIFTGQSRTSEFLQLNPMAQVPVLVDDGFVLTEGNAIMQYICQKYRNELTKQLYPDDLIERAQVDKFLH